MVKVAEANTSRATETRSNLGASRRATSMTHTSVACTIGSSPVLGQRRRSSISLARRRAPVLGLQCAARTI